MTNAKRTFRSIISCLSGIVLFGAAWSLYQRGFFVPWQNLGYPSGAYLSADTAVEILATDGRLIQIRTSGGHTLQTAVAWHNEKQSFWWAGFWYPDNDEISGATAANFGCPYGLLAPPRPRWFAQVMDKVTFSGCRQYVGETQLRVILFKDGNVWVWAYDKNIEEDSSRFLGLWLILGGLAGLGIGWSGLPIQRLKVVLAAGMLVSVALGISWWMMGYWWNPFSPCELPLQPHSGTIEPPWILPFGAQVIEDRGHVSFSPANGQALPANNLRIEMTPQANCFSSTCTLVYECSGQVVVDQNQFAIHIHLRFTVKPSFYWRLGAVCACSEDCGGAGSLDYETGPLREGVYQVWLGETRLGEISVPLQQFSQSLHSPLPPSPTPANPLYPPPISTPIIAYPAPVSASPAPATPYPEPLLASPTEPLSPTLIAAETLPKSIWYSPIITIPLSSSRVGTIFSGEWISPTCLGIETLGTNSGNWFLIDLSGEMTEFHTNPVPFPRQSFSSSGLYSVYCDYRLQMFDVTLQKTVSRVELALNPKALADCSSYVSWGGDIAATFAAGEDGAWSTYLWRPDGSAPLRVGSALTGTTAPVWAPDQQHFAFLSFRETSAREMQMVIANQNGDPALTIPVVSSPTSAAIQWFSPQVIAFDSETGWQFYAIPDGKLLFIWSQASGIALNQYNEFPALSPDSRWFLLERSGANANAMFHKIYSLYDVHNRQEIQVYDLPWHGMVYNGWSPNKEMLYLLHIPKGPDAVSDVDLPYGLLAYHLAEGRFETLVENAQSVSWDAGYQRALVYIFVQNNAGQATLSASIWDADRKQTFGAYPITYPPTQYDFLLRPAFLGQFVPAVWSPDGQLAAFFTWGGELVLMDLAGQTQLLASRVGLGRSDFTRLLAWSPDGSHLFVSDRGTAWVVTVPAVGHWR